MLERLDGHGQPRGSRVTRRSRVTANGAPRRGEAASVTSALRRAPVGAVRGQDPRLSLTSVRARDRARTRQSA